VMKMSPVFLVFMLKNRPEPNKTGSVWTGSRFGSGYINKKYYFPVRLNFWVKTGPNRTVNTPTSYRLFSVSETFTNRENIYHSIRLWAHDFLRISIWFIKGWNQFLKSKFFTLLSHWSSHWFPLHDIFK